VTKLNQILALDAGRRSVTTREVTDIYHKLQKPALVSGITRTYQSRTAVENGGDVLPPESTSVQLKVDDALDGLAASFTRLFDLTLTKDKANQEAAADVKVGTTVILPKAPVTFLLFLEKQLEHMHTELKTLPVVDPSEEWRLDETRGVWATPVVQTHRTKKVPKAMVLYEATKEHAAQVQAYTEDVIEGYWSTVKFSGAASATRKQVLLERIQDLQEAVKRAREEANSIDVTDYNVGDSLFGYLLAP